MRKSISLLIISYLLLSCAQHSNIKSDLTEANLKGNVSKIDRTNHDTKNKCACVVKTECNESVYIYNKTGNLAVSYTIDENGIVNDSTAYVYNRHGVCTEIIRFSGKKSSGKDIPSFQGEKASVIKRYNENGEIISTTTYNYGGNSVEENTYDKQGGLAGSIRKELLNGQMVSQTEKDKDGNTISITKFKRNGSDDVVENTVLVTKDNKEYTFKYEYDYDAAGNWIKQTRFYDGQIENIVIRNIEYYKVQ